MAGFVYLSVSVIYLLDRLAVRLAYREGSAMPWTRRQVFEHLIRASDSYEHQFLIDAGISIEPTLLSILDRPTKQQKRMLKVFAVPDVSPERLDLFIVVLAGLTDRATVQEACLPVPFGRSRPLPVERHSPCTTQDADYSQKSGPEVTG